MPKELTEDADGKNEECTRLRDAVLLAALFGGIFAIGAEVTAAVGIGPEWLKGRTYIKGCVGSGMALAFWAWDTLRKGKFVW